MAVHVEHLTSTMHVTDADALLSPRTRQQLVAAVLAELERMGERDRRMARDRAVLGGRDERGRVEA